MLWPCADPLRASFPPLQSYGRTAMTSAPTNACTPREQAHVVQLYKETLRQVKINHDSGTKYITIDLSNQANAEASATRDYRGRYLFELLQNANDAITAA